MGRGGGGKEGESEGRAVAREGGRERRRGRYGWRVSLLESFVATWLKLTESTNEFCEDSRITLHQTPVSCRHRDACLFPCCANTPRGHFRVRDR